MQPLDEIIFLTRMGERLLAVIIGGLCVVLGYLLFTKLPEKADAEGKIILPGGINIWLSRIGPGVFFALFGAVIVAMSFGSPIQFKSHTIVPQNDTSREAVIENRQELQGIASGFGVQMPVLEEKQRLSEARTRIYTLNHDWNKSLRSDLNRQDREMIEVAIDYSKRQILRAVWLEGWGSFADFEKWVNNGATLPPPPAISIPVEIYFLGKENS